MKPGLCGFPVEAPFTLISTPVLSTAHRPTIITVLGSRSVKSIVVRYTYRPGCDGVVLNRGPIHFEVAVFGAHGPVTIGNAVESSTIASVEARSALPISV